MLVLLSILIIIILFVFFYERQENFTFDDKLLTTYNKHMVCSKDLDALKKYYILNKAGGTMAIRHHRPMDNTFKPIDCPHIKDNNHVCYQRY